MSIDVSQKRIQDVYVTVTRGYQGGVVIDVSQKRIQDIYVTVTRGYQGGGDTS